MKIKRIAAGLCAVVMACGLVFAPVGETGITNKLLLSASAEETYTYNGYEYTIYTVYPYVAPYEGIKLLRYNGKDKKTKMPSEIDGIPVSYISSEIFAENTNIEEVTIPSYSYLEIPIELHFEGCTVLKTMKIECSFDELKEQLSGVSNLKTVYLYGSVKKLGDTFARNENLTDFYFKNNDTKMDFGEYAFSGCNNLTIHNLPKIRSVEDYAFYQCKKIKKVQLDKSIKKIGECAFLGTSITSIDLPDGLTEIGSQAFEKTNLTSIKIPESVKKYGTHTFADCKKLKCVELPDNITKIYLGMFSYTSSLGKIKLPASVKTIDDSAFFASGVKSVELNDGVKKIGKQAFAFCDNLKEITIPKSVTSINKTAFEKTTLIRCYKNSAAHKYAIKWNIPYELLDGTSLKKCKISVASDSYYTGKAVKPTVSVKYKNKTLKKGTDYRISYKNNMKVGIATVTVRGIGDYTGKVTKKFIVKPAAVKLTSVRSAGKGKVKATWKKNAQADGYQIIVSTAKNFKKGKKVVTVKNSSVTSKTIKTLKSGQKYYVKIRAYKTISGKKRYGKFSTTKSVSVN